MGTASAHPSSPRLTGWFVTARHRQTGPHGEPRPWGAVHVKRIGEPMTACGVVTLGWQVFWRVPAASVLAELCVDCREGALADAQEGLSRCDAC
ncbi:hypothetical protein GCM10011584_05780 [Nocardioides phosphati]|uniref:Uncharacterized protein n=1 Tax=Nocardioides phosphati TaxID=1867775 RepID=A0ABQ2NB48_9ACTN|nr:hypothetical protein [Nocardioides phosphati]GGO85552.1 hypothetical protein GCM10011584_05780 [Nocardioides phosphati]